MVFLPQNSKIIMTFYQGDIGSQVPVDIGSCTSTYGYNSYSGLDFEFNKNMQNLPFQIPTNRKERILVCGSLAVGIAEAGSKVGYITFEVLHDSHGPKGISQISPQIVVRDNMGKSLAKPYKPKELHNFDLNNGEILSTIKINNEEVYTQKIE